MSGKITDGGKRVYLITSLILLIGLGGSAFIYFSAETGSGVPGLEAGSGIKPEDTKMYQHDLELYGGKANVIAVDFARWFSGLWRGKTLAFTTACITVLTAFVFFIAAGRLRTSPKADDAKGPA